MKLYRDLQPGETLQAGDERLCVVSLTWSPIAETAVGWQVLESAPLYRRPVDLPMLQPVTLEAIKELEGKDTNFIGVAMRGCAKTMLWNTKLHQWCSNAGFDNPLEWGWFIDLSTIPEVQQ